MFTLRQFRPTDLDTVMQINRIYLPENYSSLFFMDLHRRFPKTFIVAEEDEEIIGYVMCRIETPFPGVGLLGIAKRGHVISIAVMPKYRRRNVGSMLMEKALEAMVEYNAKQCVLEVRTGNTAGINLYRKMGFQIKRTIHRYYADGEDACVMARSLPYEPSSRY
jgi:ribosomal-protein-alanine N-acetyltransferase